MRRIKPQPPQRHVYRVRWVTMDKNKLSLVLQSPDLEAVPLPSFHPAVGDTIIVEPLEQAYLCP